MMSPTSFEGLSVFIAAAVLIASYALTSWFSASAAPKKSVVLPTAFTASSEDDQGITPLWAFDYRKVDPIRYRPYVTQGHVTMGIQKSKREEWVRIDKGYLGRLREREHLIRDKPTQTIGNELLAYSAIKEFYQELMVDYLPRRYPTIFTVEKEEVYNAVTKRRYPLSTDNLTSTQMLTHIGLNVEEDFYFVCPDDEDTFYMRGYVSCFPSGFLSSANLGQSVREIHEVVPGYEERLAKAVDRYFKRMEPGQFVNRMNWSLQVDGGDLFRLGGEQSSQEIEKKRKPDLDQCFLRVEHQTLCALPKSRAIVFCVRNYMTSLRQVREEGDGAVLADAIESMPEKLGVYKSRMVWGSEIVPWLRSPAA